MTASKNPEKITGQVLRSFRHCVIYIFPYGSKSHSILICALLLRSNLFASAECLRNVKRLKNKEFQEFEN